MNIKQRTLNKKKKSKEYKENLYNQKGLLNFF